MYSDHNDLFFIYLHGQIELAGLDVINERRSHGTFDTIGFVTWVMHLPQSIASERWS
jgi:hypothetical protein